MGAGGQQANQHPLNPRHDAPLCRSPAEKPPFTLGQIKKAIPPHCFDRSLLRSLSYMAFDLLFASAFLYIAIVFIPTLPDPLGLLAWPLYWSVEGCVLTGLWVIAHECGHHAFSDYSLIDDALGLVLHSALLVPYFSWKYSHRRHHSNTGSLERDEVFLPKRRVDIRWYSHYLNNPLGRVLTLLITVTLGWPLYLMFNMSGRAYPRFACHFDPYRPIYSPRERLYILVSDVGIGVVLYWLYKFATTLGIVWVVKVYGVPLLVVNAWLVTITYLQHTHSSMPHYGGDEWEWLKGALVTVDRDYGLLNIVFHHIADTDVVHHLFSTMPHYHAMEATKAIKPLLGEYYRFDGTPVLKALYREAKECMYVEVDDAKGKEKSGVFWYKNKL